MRRPDVAQQQSLQAQQQAAQQKQQGKHLHVANYYFICSLALQKVVIFPGKKPSSSSQCMVNAASTHLAIYDLVFFFTFYFFQFVIELGKHNVLMLIYRKCIRYGLYYYQLNIF